MAFAGSLSVGRSLWQLLDARKKSCVRY